MKSTKYNLFSNLQNGSASSKGKRFNLQSKYHDTAILTWLWYITKICFRTVHGRNIIFFSVLRIEDMFEVHIVNSNILTSKNLFLFFEMARVKLTVWFLVPLSVLRLRAERLGFFYQDGGHVERKGSVFVAITWEWWSERVALF